MPPTGDPAHSPGMCPDWELNWQTFGLQAGTQSTEPHQPGLKNLILKQGAIYLGLIEKLRQSWRTDTKTLEVIGNAQNLIYKNYM